MGGPYGAAAQSITVDPVSGKPLLGVIPDAPNDPSPSAPIGSNPQNGPSNPGPQGPSSPVGSDPLRGPAENIGDVTWKATEKRTDGYNRHKINRGPWSVRLGADRNYYVDRQPSEFVERDQKWESRERMGGRVRTFRKEFWAFAENPKSELNIRAHIANMEVNARVRSELILEQTDLESDAGSERGKAPDRSLPDLRQFLFQTGAVQGKATVGNTGIDVDYIWHQADFLVNYMVLARAGPGVDEEETSDLLASFQSAVIKALPKAKAKAILRDPSSALKLPQPKSGVIVAHHKMLSVVHRDFVAGKNTVGKADDLWKRWEMAARRDMHAMLQFAFLTIEKVLDRRRPFVPDADRNIYGTTLESSWKRLSTWFKGSGVVVITRDSRGTIKITPLTSRTITALAADYADAMFR